MDNTNQVLPFEVRLCVIYVRVSSDDQRDGFSIPAQIELLLNYARSKNLRIVRIFEESMSAKDSGRIEFNRMLKYLKNHPEVKIILVEKTDRLYRNFKDYAVIDDSKYEIHLVKENEILSKDSTSHQKLIHGLKVLLAKNFIDNLREETRKGRKKKAEEGYIVGGAPYGYKKVNKKDAEPVEPEATFVREAYKLYSNGKSLAQVREAMLKKMTYRDNEPAIARGHLHRMLQNVYYSGRVPFEGKIFPGKFPAIVDLETWERVQVLLKKEKEYARDFLYAGLMRCERCGSLITMEMKKEKYIYYRCTGGQRNCRQRSIHLSEEYITRAFQRAIDKLYINPEKRKWLEKQLSTEMRHTKVISLEGKEEAEEDIKKIKGFLDNLYDDKLEGRITEEFWQRKNDDLTRQLDEAQARLQSLMITRHGDVAECMRKIDNIGLIPQMFREGGYTIQKNLAKIIFSRITLKGRILHFEYAMPFKYFLREETSVDELESGFYD